MHVVITGASGFVGAGLTGAILARKSLGGRAIERLTLVDREFSALPAEGLETFTVAGDFGDAAVLDQVLSEPVDLLFHLASVPGWLAEREYDIGWQVNLLATLSLMNRLARQGKGVDVPPRLVFASSIAVYGALSEQPVTRDTPARPTLSYGAHKLIAEIALADLSRRGEIDARSLRLPGIVARPMTESGHGSAFMSQIFHKLAAGLSYECPVSSSATAWWMSLPCCIENLIHAATFSEASSTPDRVWQLPVLHLSLDEVVDGLAQRFGSDRKALVTYRPNEDIERHFGRLPPLEASKSFKDGFMNDGTVDSLIRNALSV